MTPSAKHQAEMLQEAGLLYTDILQLIANQTDATSNQVKALFEDAGVKVVEFDNETHKKAGMIPVDIRQSDTMRQTLEAGCRKTYNQMWNLTKTLAVTTQKEYINACNNAYMQISSGAFSYNDAITNAVKNAAVGGLDVKYPSGNVAKLDVAIRRAVLTGVRQTCTEISRENAVECGCYLMEITAHSGSRPEHEKWQGQLATLTGKNAGKIIDGMKVYTLHEIGYGDVDGFCGANCHHDWDPYYEGISTPNYTKEELDEMNAANIEYKGKMYTEYQISQMQRYRERHIRELKRQTAKAQDIVDFTDNPELKATAQANYQATASRLKKAEQGLKDFCKATGRDREKSREQVLGFSHSEAQRAVHAAKKYKENKSTTKNTSNTSKSSSKTMQQWLTKIKDDGKIDIEYFKKSLKNGEVNTTIEKGQQQKHQSSKAWRQQVKQAVASNGKLTPKSVLFKSIDPQEIVNKYGGTGEFMVTKGNSCMNEFIKLPYIIGTTFDKKQGKYVKTDTIQIKYTNKGVHIFPTTQKEK